MTVRLDLRELIREDALVYVTPAFVDICQNTSYIHVYRLLVVFFSQALVSSFWRRVSGTSCISVTEGQQKGSWDQTPQSLQTRSRPHDSQHKTGVSPCGPKWLCSTGAFSGYLQPLTPWVRLFSSFSHYNLDTLMTGL